MVSTVSYAQKSVNDEKIFELVDLIKSKSSQKAIEDNCKGLKDVKIKKLLEFYKTIPKSKEISTYTPRLSNPNIYSIFFYNKHTKEEFGTLMLYLEKGEIMNINISYPKQEEINLKDLPKIPLPPGAK